MATAKRSRRKFTVETKRRLLEQYKACKTPEERRKFFRTHHLNYTDIGRFRRVLARYPSEGLPARPGRPRKPKVVYPLDTEVATPVRLSDLAKLNGSSATNGDVRGHLVRDIEWCLTMAQVVLQRVRAQLDEIGRATT